MRLSKAAWRVFSDDKMVENRILNVLGVQVLRSIIARTMHLSRSVTVPPLYQAHRNALERDGLVVWPQFLEDGLFQVLERECQGLTLQESRLRSRPSGPNSCRKAMIRDFSEADTSALRSFLQDDRLRSLLRAAERRSIGDLLDVAEIEELVHGTGAGVDPQSEAHSDIFFASHKAWFYLTDVRLEDGPLAFVEGSHKLSLSQLRYVYAHSVRLHNGVDRSRRIGRQEMAECVARERVLAVPRNTLVIANTSGYHRRLQGEAGRRRLSIHFELRGHPFRTLDS